MPDIQKALIPYPQKISASQGEKLIAVASKPYFKLEYEECDDSVYAEAINLIRGKILDIAAVIHACDDVNSYSIKLCVNPDDPKFADVNKAESYFIDITDEYAILCGYDANGLYYAASTFSQLLYAKGDGVYLPKVTIVDWPDFADRSLFMECRYGADFMTRDDWYRAVDYLSEMKYNRLTIGVYGCWGVQYDTMLSEYLFIPFKKYKELQTPRNIKYYSVLKRKWIYKEKVLPTMFEDDYLGDLIGYGKKKNVKIIPLFNSLGHNSLLPRVFPEISAKDENGKDTGYGVCTSSQITYDLMFELYDEIIEKYLQPNGIDSIHIGLDEVRNSMGIDKNDMYRDFSAFCQCEKCRTQSNAENMIIYIIKLCKYLKAKGMKKIYIYHDMLFYHFDTINEALRDRFIKEDIYDVVVIDWWSYSGPEKLFRERAAEVNNLFRSIIKPMTGYYHWTVPTERNTNIRECVQIAYKLGYEGIEAYSSFDYCFDKNFLYQAELAWNTSMLEKQEDFNQRYAYRLYPGSYDKAVQVLETMHELMKRDAAKNYIDDTFEYYLHGYLKAGLPYPRNYPGEAFEVLFDDEKTYIPYLETVRAKAKYAVDFFKNECGAGHWLNDVWLLMAKHYYVVANEYLTLASLHKSYNSNTTDAFHLLSAVEGLLEARERVMKLAETVKIEANQYMFLRNMSISRQYLCDLRNYVKDCIAKGEKPKLDVTDLNYTNSEIFYFLR